MITKFEKVFGQGPVVNQPQKAVPDGNAFQKYFLKSSPKFVLNCLYIKPLKILMEHLWWTILSKYITMSSKIVDAAHWNELCFIKFLKLNDNLKF